MNFKNGKRKIGLIALFACVFTATVAFAAYTGYNYINGTVTVEGSPFKMVYADKDGNPVAETADGKIAAVGHATVSGSAATEDDVADGILTDLRVSAFADPEHTISAFNVKLKEKGDTIVYTFKIKNTGGATAYLSAVDIAEFTMPTDSKGTAVSGLEYSISLGDNITVTSTDGELVSAEAPTLSVAPAATVDVTLTVKATKDSLFSAWDPAGDSGTGSYGATITLGEIKITWSAVDPSKA